MQYRTVKPPPWLQNSTEHPKLFNIILSKISVNIRKKQIVKAKPKNDHMILNIFLRSLHTFPMLFSIKKHFRNTHIIPCLNPSTFQRIGTFELKKDNSFQENFM